MKYPFAEIEKKWQEYWANNKVNLTDLTDIEKKLYCLVMFIYPSASKTHCGHWYNYAPTDSWARFKKLQGYNVFEPIGYDAFGLPAENYAIKTGIHPYDSTLENIAAIREQLKLMGCMYDWDKELMTCAPEYYKWNQWLFIQLFKKGMAYRKNAPVNWCPSCQTVLANEQVLNDGGCERCGTTVFQKNLTQWFYKITDYAEELLKGLETIDWPERTKTMQTNWIGKSTGAEVNFKIEGLEDVITVFTTRPDTLFGVTYVVLAPELPLVDKITKTEFLNGVNEYRESIKSLTEVERTSTVKEKTGVPTGSYAINPVNGEKIPIWIADYALATYGTGCVMAVPGHDERDFEFASKFNLPIVKVILEKDTAPDSVLEKAFTDEGVMINSGEYDGINSEEFKTLIVEELSKTGDAKAKINFRLRDWLISRQRYWGTPIPIVHCENCGEVPVPEEQLPVELPYDVKFTPGGGSPLASSEEFINTTCPKCGGAGKREVDTMDTFMDSSWYYLRYLNPHFDKGMFDPELANKWTPVDMYVGGAEHTVMHLLYARFIHKFIRDLGLVNSDEPFAKLIHQGTITNNGAKMSKSRNNVVNPSDFTAQVGSDVFRMYLMFMGPYELGGDWSDKGIVGVDRFVQRIYTLFMNHQDIAKTSSSKESYELDSLSEGEKIVYKKINYVISKIGKEIEGFHFNVAVALLMELLNDVTKYLPDAEKTLQTYVLERLAVCLMPLAPHLGEECWQLLGKDTTLSENPVWYSHDEKALVVENITIVVQINGKIRARLDFPANTSEDEVKTAVWKDEKVILNTEGKQVVKEMYVNNKIYTIVVK